MLADDIHIRKPFFFSNFKILYVLTPIRILTNVLRMHEYPEDAWNCCVDLIKRYSYLFLVWLNAT